MKLALHLNDILSASLVLGCLSAILLPVLRQAVPADDFTEDITRLHNLGLGVLSYSVDVDDCFPLGHGRRSDGVDGWIMMKYFPRDWPLTPDPERSRVSAFFVFNTILPYMPSSPPTPDTRFAAPGSPSFEYRPDLQVAPGKTKLASTYAYNGLLHGFPEGAVTRPDKLPLMTGANGFMNELGSGRANPMLECDGPYPVCRYAPSTWGCLQSFNGGKSSMFPPLNGGSLLHYFGGQNWLLADGHVDFRRLASTGRARNTATDIMVDPWLNYDRSGRATHYYSDGCHPWLFRPDYDFLQ